MQNTIAFYLCITYVQKHEYIKMRLYGMQLNGSFNIFFFGDILQFPVLGALYITV